MTEEDKKEVYLEADKEIPGQHYACLSFLSPEKVIANKDVFFFTEFLKDYEIQYKIKSTESFVMKQVNQLQESVAKVQALLENMLLKPLDEITTEEAKKQYEESVKTIKEARATITKDVATDMEQYIRSEMREFKQTSIQEAFDSFLFKNRKRLEDDYFAKNNFRTTIRGLKIRGVYDTYNEAVGRAKTLQKLDPTFNVYVAQVGFWLPWDPEPSDVANQEYADDQLNQLMKKYKENEQQRDEFYEEMKRTRIGEKSTKQAGTAGVPIGAKQDTPSDMFAGEDLAIARKREQASTSESTINHV